MGTDWRHVSPRFSGYKKVPCFRKLTSEKLPLNCHFLLQVRVISYKKFFKKILNIMGTFSRDRNPRQPMSRDVGNRRVLLEYAVFRIKIPECSFYGHSFLG